MYVVKRLFTMLITLWIIATLTFVIMHLIPGDPFAAESQMLPADVLKNLRAQYHLDDPLSQQYVHYLQRLVQLDLGPSIQSKSRTVNTLIASGIGPSAVLGVQAIVIALALGITLGVIAALRHNGLIDYAAMFFAIIGISIPSFILAPLLIKYIAVNLRWLPVASWGTWQHTVLPSLALALAPLAVIARFVRASMLEVLGQNYIRLAEAKGLSSWAVVIKYGLRNALLPVITFIGPLFAALITGTFVVEKIFSIPGLGKYFVDSIFNRDYPVIMGTTMFYSFVLVVTLFLVDISYRLVDPRIKLTSKGDGL